MNYAGASCEEFVSALASKEPVPGGGGASAVVGAIGAALGNMVGSLTAGKKKYAGVESEILALRSKADFVQSELLRLADEDAKAFGPLAEAYRMPSATEEQRFEKDRVMEAALDGATVVPLEIMRLCCEAITLLRSFANKGSSLAISDAGAGAALCKAALMGASLNVYINTKAMKNRERAGEYIALADTMLQEYAKAADCIYNDVLSRLRDEKQR